MIKSILILVFFLFFINTSFGNDDIIQINTQQTIKEIKNNLENLNEEKTNLKEKVETLIEESGEFKGFFRSDLNEKDISKINEIINGYTINNKKTDALLKNNAKNLESSSEEKKLILNYKKDSYKNLIPFINEDKLDEYLEFTKKDLDISEEKGNVNEKIYINEEVLTKKVEKLKEKIVKNKEVINEKIDKVIKEKIESKINFLKKSDNFNKLSNSQKREIILKVIEKIKIKISTLNKDGQKNKIPYKKLELYNMTLNLLYSFYNKLK